MNAYPEVKPIADYAAIGNTRTVVLVGRDGSIDWCPFPHVDRQTVFAALLDVKRGGYFRICPVNGGRAEQRYQGDTNILDTIFEAGGTRLTITDFMPLWDDINGTDSSEAKPEVQRIVTCEGGDIDILVDWAPRFNYARDNASIERIEGGRIAMSEKDSLALAGLPEAEVMEGENGPVIRAKIRLISGEQRLFVTRWHSTNGIARLDEARSDLERTRSTWLNWVHKESVTRAKEWAGNALPQMIRSELVLKLMTHADTGAMVAAPTTSLPETIGGARNWDYRFTWIRDAALTAQAFTALGHPTEALQFLEWAERVSEEQEGAHRRLQIMYGLHGEAQLPEEELSHLAGYRSSRPVRIGNKAAEQLQLDIYGELMTVGYELARRGHILEDHVMHFLQHLADRACKVWTEPDYGIWEMRGEPRHFVHSKVMIWVALDRALRLAGEFNLKGDIGCWQSTRDEILQAIIEHGYDEEQKSFIQSYDTPHFDASNLRLPMLEFLEVHDERIQGTINGILENLTHDGLVYRYKMDDGLEGEEGAFGLCSFWLIDALALSGRLDEAWKIFDAMSNHANHVGLYPEQFDVSTGEFLGNFPQAFTHIGFMNSVLYLAHAEGRKVPGHPPAGATQPAGAEVRK